ncbi:hydantoinase/oxoprolinase family protein [Pelagibius litoralis]|uniref:hydantoinase/oxoprolinase family protein n=1 Tax=Pelagibius litoralis TaxID=374515 RepID=UPI0019805367|nr:hydantoinase/oxoprolinase family protein [Pelagibius litoralis]
MEAEREVTKIGVDVGGTFTDLVLETTKDGASRVHVHKVSSTPEDQSKGVLRGIKEICQAAQVEPGDVKLVVHGTTIATNITLEHNGAEVGMLTTRGFRDILHIARHKRPHNFSMQFDVPWQSKPLIKRRNRIPISERILPPSGAVDTPLNEQEVREAAELFKKRGLTAVVVAFLFSFLNNQHERRAKEIIQEVLPDAYVCCSSEVVDVIREYERFSTTAMNAYVGPRTSRYLRNLERSLKEAGFNAALRIMQSNGGIGTTQTCSEKAVTILMSGPAGGVIAGRWAGGMSGVDNLITVDIGGTSADISTIPAGEIKIMNPRDTYVGDYPVLAPMIDLATIGAGGGSIAYLDEGGAFRVGPRSAGADPGPVCYAKGGKEPTVTDAQVVLGRLDADKLLGGDLKVDPDLARQAIDGKLARPMGLSVEEAALGIIRIVNNNMALAIRANSVARGFDPRDFALMPFGGAGPLHGVALARIVSANEVIVPPAPGITAAVGLLVTDMQYEFTRSVLAILNEADQKTLDNINVHAEKLEQLCRERLVADGVPPEEHRFVRIAECRYQGQGFELRAEMPGGPVTLENKDIVMENFHRQHKQDYGYAFEGSLVEVVTLRVIGVADVESLEWPRLGKANGTGIDSAYLFSRPTTFDDGQTLETPRYDRGKLLAGHEIPGPGIIIQHNSTTLVPPGCTARVLESGNMHVSV